MPIEGILNYLAAFIIVAGIYAIFTLGLNVHWGYTGIMNFGVAGFFAIGAYISALVTLPLPHGEYAIYVQQLFGFNLPFFAGVLAGAIGSGLIALIIGIPALRLREDHLAIASIGIAETIRLIFNNERWLANGPLGLVGIPAPMRGLVPPHIYNYLYLAIVLAFLLTIYFAIERGIRSPWGRVLRAIREDETVVLASGKNVFWFRLQALILGAGIMGLGGALYAHFVRTIQPGVFEPLFGTFLIWVMLIVGGSGNNKGAIIGAFVVWAIWSGTDFLTGMLVPAMFGARAFYLRFVFIGLLLVAILILRPRGIVEEEREVSKLMNDNI